MTVGSLFSGIGGLDLGFERAGFELRWMVERDPFCRAALAKHWPGVPCYPDARMSPAQWRQLERVDVLIGGFPCQDVSDAGHRLGLGGDRSGLWWCLRRAARVLRPRVLVVENVPGLFTRGFGTVLGSLARIGFDAEWSVVRASDVGAPHRRARVFILAYPEYRRGAARGGCDSQPPGVTNTDRGGVLVDPAIPGPQRDQPEGGQGVIHGWPAGSIAGPWPARPGEPQHAWEPPRVIPGAQRSVGSVPDGVPNDLAGWRRAALQATGNAVVPKVAECVAARVLELLTHQAPPGSTTRPARHP